LFCRNRGDATSRYSAAHKEKAALTRRPAEITGDA